MYPWGGFKTEMYKCWVGYRAQYLVEFGCMYHTPEKK